MKFLVIDVRKSSFNVTDEATGAVNAMSGYMVDGLVYDETDIVRATIFVDSKDNFFNEFREFNIFKDQKLWFRYVDVDLRKSRIQDKMKFRFIHPPAGSK